MKNSRGGGGRGRGGKRGRGRGSSSSAAHYDVDYVQPTLTSGGNSSNYAGSSGFPSSAAAAVEIENQFILRLPSEPAEALREAIKAGASNIKERLSIQLEPDKNSANPSYLRKGFVEFDGWNMSAKLCDVPTVISSHKTIDRKNFYKTADICQILLCKEGAFSDDSDADSESEASSSQAEDKRKDPLKVEKKYRYPHGLSNPLKNCRKRRFRKTLKKKFVEAPEIEKEVKRLLRVDNEAVNVTWDLVHEEQLNKKEDKKKDKAESSDLNVSSVSDSKLDEQALFGGALSDSDDDRPKSDVDIDSEGDSNLFGGVGNEGRPTSFSKEMFVPPQPSQAAPPETSADNAVANKIDQLKHEINQLKVRKKELESNIAHCDNQVLQMRFQETLNEVENELMGKEMEMESMSMLM